MPLGPLIALTLIALPIALKHREHLRELAADRPQTTRAQVAGRILAVMIATAIVTAITANVAN